MARGSPLTVAGAATASTWPVSRQISPCSLLIPEGNHQPKIVTAPLRCLPARLANYTPVDSMAQQRNERIGFPGSAENGRRRICGVGVGARGADGGVVAMTEGKIGHAAAADLATITKHAAPTVR